MVSAVLGIQADVSDPVATTDSFFGSSVTVLPNGNIVVTAPFYDAVGDAQAIGAVYLYSPAGTMISKLTGSRQGDNIGSHGVKVLTNGNYVICSGNWNGASFGAGAVTWGHRDTGVNGVVSAANSLVGSIGDYVGASDTQVDELFTGATVVPLTNGNYVVCSRRWNNGSVQRAGAVTWGNGATGSHGVVSPANSMVGATEGGEVGARGAIALTNGNYVFGATATRNSSGASTGSATWGNGNVGSIGVVSEANSLMGSVTYDYVSYAGSGTGLVALGNGNYLVCSGNWDGGKGAVTWGSGSGGLIGRISGDNSLVGTTAGDGVGMGAALPNYYERSFVAALSNGNYVVAVPKWKNGSVIGCGAIVLGNGASGLRGEISTSSALVGSKLQQLGSGGVTALANGHFVIASPEWTIDGLVVGAVTWGEGNTTLGGEISVANSLVGSIHSGRIAGAGVTALTNGNYVVNSPQWFETSTGPAGGAITWCDGSAPRIGGVTRANSITGTLMYFPGAGTVTALQNGDFAVISPQWHEESGVEIGSITWGHGNGDAGRVISADNSLVGSSANDLVGAKVIGLTNGNLVAAAPNWTREGLQKAGAVTWLRPGAISHGVISPANSLVGKEANDQVGLSRLAATADGNYIVRSDRYRVGLGFYRGASTLGNGRTGTTGEISTANSVLSSSADAFYSGEKEGYDPNFRQMVVGRTYDGRITFFADELNALGVELEPGDSAAIHIPAQPGKSYLLNRSYDLKNWSYQGSIQASATGMVFFRDGLSPVGRAFYRLQEP